MPGVVGEEMLPKSIAQNRVKQDQLVSALGGWWRILRSPLPEQGEESPGWWKKTSVLVLWWRGIVSPTPKTRWRKSSLVKTVFWALHPPPRALDSGEVSPVGEEHLFWAMVRNMSTFMNVYYTRSSSMTSIIHTQPHASRGPQPLRPLCGVVWDLQYTVLMLTGGTLFLTWCILHTKHPNHFIGDNFNFQVNIIFYNYTKYLEKTNAWYRIHDVQDMTKNWGSQSHSRLMLTIAYFSELNSSETNNFSTVTLLWFHISSRTSESQKPLLFWYLSQLSDPAVLFAYVETLNWPTSIASSNIAWCF